MELTGSTVESLASEYEQLQPFAAVEREHRALLPDALAAGEFGWRDVEWVVQWYYRRFLGTYPNRERREREAAFGENSDEDVQTAIVNAASAADNAAKLDALTALSGVDVPVASAFLLYLHPNASVVLSEREWSVLARTSHLDDPYPEDPGVETYHRYLSVCRTVADRFDVDVWTLYRAIWTCWADDELD